MCPQTQDEEKWDEMFTDWDLNLHFEFVELSQRKTDDNGKSAFLMLGKR